MTVYCNVSFSNITQYTKMTEQSKKEHVTKSFRLPVELVDKAVMLAEADRRTFTSIVEMALADFLPRLEERITNPTN